LAEYGHDGRRLDHIQVQQIFLSLRNSVESGSAELAHGVHPIGSETKLVGIPQISMAEGLRD
jgi:hypothetical protein